MASATFRTKNGYEVILDQEWDRADFRWLGCIYMGEGHRAVPWAWHADGRSIDRADRAFDLVDFPQADNLAETVAADG